MLEFVLSPRTLASVHECWDALAAARSSPSTDVMREALTRLASLIDAQNAFWLGSVRVSNARADDPLNGWRPRAIRYLNPSPVNTSFAQRGTRGCEVGDVDESTVAHAQQAGVFRARLLSELVSSAWYESRFYDIAYRARGIRDALFVVAPVNRDAESFFGFHRIGEQPLFTPDDRDVAAHALRGLHWLHREAMLREGLLLARKPLTPTEQRVLDLLLSELTEKEIASALGRGTRTTHHHVTEIQRKFGVNSRAGLMAIWLGRR